MQMNFKSLRSSFRSSFKKFVNANHQHQPKFFFLELDSAYFILIHFYQSFKSSVEFNFYFCYFWSKRETRVM